MSSILHTLPVQRIRPVFAWLPFTRSLLDQNGLTTLAQQGTPTWSKIGLQDALAFNDTTQYFTAGHSSTLDLADVSAFAWGSFRQEVNGTLFRKLGTGTRYQLYTNNTTQVSMYNGTTVSSITTDVTGLFSFGVTSPSGDRVRFFGDGAFLGVGNNIITWSSTDSTFYLGGAGVDTMFKRASGLLLYDGVLTDAEHALLHRWARQLRSPIVPHDRRFFDMGQLVPVGSDPHYGDNGPDVAVDGDMEAAGTAAWTASASAVLTKETTDPHAGTQCLRITYGGVANGRAYQDVLTAGTRYRLRGWARGDGGVGIPRLYNGALTLLWVGTNSTTWQYFDVSFMQTIGTAYYLWNAGASVSYTEFDDISIEQTNNFLSDSDMEASSTYDWSASSATLTKETTNPYQGSQVLRITQTAGTGLASQAVMTLNRKYRIIGHARSDGTARPILRNPSGATIWTGVVSTAWQLFDIELTPTASSSIFLGSDTGGAGNYSEFDAVTVWEVGETVVALDFGVTREGVVIDQSGNGKDASLVGHTPVLFDIGGRATQLDGHADIAVSPLVVHADFSIEALVRPTVTGDIKVFAANGTGNGIAVMLFIDATEKIQFQVEKTSDSSYRRVLDTAGYGMYEAPLYIVGTYNATTQTAELYVNGIVQTFKVSSASIDALGGTALVFGARNVDFIKPFYGKAWYTRVVQRIMSAEEVARRYNELAKGILYDLDLSKVRPTTANLTAGAIPGTDYEIVSGTWKVVDDLDAKYIECVAAGRLARKQTEAFGSTWIRLSKDGSGGGATSPLVTIMAASKTLALTDVGQTGYYLNFLSNEGFYFREMRNGGVGSLFYSDIDYVVPGTVYDIWISADINSEFTAWIRGGAYTEWTLIPAIFGTNPGTDNTTTTSQYRLVEFGVGDRLYWDRQYLGAFPPGP